MTFISLTARFFRASFKLLFIRHIGHIEPPILRPFRVKLSSHGHLSGELDQSDVVMTFAGAALNTSVDELFPMLKVFLTRSNPKAPCLGVDLRLQF